MNGSLSIDAKSSNGRFLCINGSHLATHVAEIMRTSDGDDEDKSSTERPGTITQKVIAVQHVFALLVGR
jgi:hypothetical protein